MNHVAHRSNNMVLTAPQGMDNCEPLPATLMTDPDPMFATFWKPTPEELALLNANGVVTLFVWGTAHPPVGLAVNHA